MIYFFYAVAGGLLANAIVAFIRFQRKRRGRAPDGFSTGDSVEVDCRSCGQFNRVPHRRLRDRPKCGRCKARLMPGNRVVICHVTPIEGPLRVELRALWDDEDRLWDSLAKHVAIQDKVRRESRGDGPDLSVN